MGHYFDKYMEQFHQDILTINHTMKAAIAEALSALNSFEKTQLKIELSEISSDENIKFVDVWNNSNSPFRLSSENKAREVLDQILEQLD